MRWMEGRRRLVEAAIGSLFVSAGALILDVAAGNGEFSALVQSYIGGLLVTQDWSSTETLASQAAGNIAVRGDALHLPFGDQVADVTIAFEIVEHFSPLEAQVLLAELYRVTKPGGMLLVSTPNRYSLESWKGLARYLVNGTIWNARDDSHVTLFSQNALHRLIEPRFEIDRCWGYFLVPEFRQRATPWTYVVSSNPLVTPLCHKLLVVAQRPAIA
jgi:ubiquinone/menaquinone biosynthesis C-methylase UbiE